MPLSDTCPTATLGLAPAVALPAQSRLERFKWFAVELSASSATLAGIYIGSTTTLGALLYLVSLVFWYTLTIKRRLWGLMPLNVATTGIASVNLWRSLYG